MIFSQVLAKHKQHNSFAYPIKKNQIHAFFTEITCLYQTLLFQHKIDSDLKRNNFPDANFCIAESLLLQIRVNSNHSSYEDLLAYFLHEFNSFDVVIFNQTLNLLIENQLIQSIITDDGHQFLDKNTQPHKHIYFKKHQKLVDCSEELANFFAQTIKTKNPQPHTNAQIFYLNHELSTQLYC